MKDSVVRGRLLQLLYERRSEGSIPLASLSRRFHRREASVVATGCALAQLSEYRLIDWGPLEDKSGMGLLSGFARINDFGVKVLETGSNPPSGFYRRKAANQHS